MWQFIENRPMPKDGSRTNSRIRYAMDVLLRGIPTPEPVVVPEPATLLGTPEPVRLYRAVEHVSVSYGGYDRTLGYYLTCEQAHEAHPGKKVVAENYWRIGSTYLSGLQVTTIHVAPKPKRAKGAK